MKPITLSVRHIIALICIALPLSLISLQSHAASGFEIACEKIDGVITDCSSSASGYTSPAVLELAGDILDYATLGYGEGRCYTGSASDFECALNDPASQTPIVLYCNNTSPPAPTDLVAQRTISDQPGNLVSCAIGGGEIDISDLLQVECDDLDTSSSCRFISDTSTLSAQIPGLTGNLKSLADSFFACASQNTASSEFQALCDQAVNQLQNAQFDDVFALLESLQALNPDASIDASWFINNLAQGNLLGRIQQLRSGLRSNPTQQQAWLHNNQWYSAGTQLAQAANSANDATPQRNISEYGKLGFFVNGTVLQAEQDASVERATETDSTVMTMGIDYRFSENTFGGLAYSLGNSTTDYRNKAGYMDIDSYLVMLYGSWYKNSWFVDGILSLGGDSYDQERHSLGHVYIADYHGSQQTLALSGGYDWVSNAWNITTSAQLQTGQLKTDAYRESSTTGLTALTFDEQTRDILMLSIGSTVQYVFSTDNGVFIPLVSIQIFNDLDDEAQYVTGRFLANDSNSTFELATNDLDTNYFVIGTGVNMQLKNGNAAFIKVESVQGYEDLDQTRFTAGWRWEL